MEKRRAEMRALRSNNIAAAISALDPLSFYTRTEHWGLGRICYGGTEFYDTDSAPSNATNEAGQNPMLKCLLKK